MKEDEEYLDKLLKSIENPDENNKADNKDKAEASANRDQNMHKDDVKPADQKSKDNSSELENVDLNKDIQKEVAKLERESKKDTMPLQEPDNFSEANRKTIEEPVIEEISKEELDQFVDNFGYLNEHAHLSKKKKSDKKQKKSFLSVLGNLFKKKDKETKPKSKLKNNNEKAGDSEETAEDRDKESDGKGKNDKTEQKPKKKVKPKKSKAKKPKAAKTKKVKKKKEKVKKVIIEEEDKNVKKLPRKSVILIFLFCFSMLAFVLLATYSVSYKNAVNLANKYYLDKDYEKVYSELNNIKLNSKEAEKLYNQSVLIVTLDKQYKSYENFMKLKEYDEALYSLVKGTQKYDEGKNKAAELEIQAEFDNIYIKIDQALQNTFKINADTVRQWDTIKIKADYKKTIENTVNQAGLVLNQ